MMLRVALLLIGLCSADAACLPPQGEPPVRISHPDAGPRVSRWALQGPAAFPPAASPEGPPGAEPAAVERRRRAAQDMGRLAVAFDGSPLERIRVQGRARWIQRADLAPPDAAGLVVLPEGKGRYYGVTVTGLPGAAPRELILRVHLRGSRSRSFRIRVDDAAGRRAGYAAVQRTCKPGWNLLRIPLENLATRNSRVLDLSAGPALVQFSAPRSGAPEEGFLIDEIRFAGEEPRKRILERIRRGLGDEDGNARARLLRRLGPPLSPESFAGLLRGPLAKDENERVRRARREVLARRGDALTLRNLLKTLDRRRPRNAERRLEDLWSLASMPSVAAREAASARIRDKRLGTAERTALLQGFTRAGARDISDLVDIFPPRGPWQPRAALAGCFVDAGGVTGIEGLIAMLRQGGSPRVLADASEGLRRLTGKDLGTDAGAWEAWWKVARRTFEEGVPRSEGASAYGRFFGLPVSQGRLAFVLDVSGSMREPVSGGRAEDHIRRSRHLDPERIKTRLDLAREELIHALEGLTAASSVGVIVYNDEAFWLTRGIEPFSRRLEREIARRLRRVSPGQRTNIHQGLYEAFHPHGKPAKDDLEKGPDTIFLLSDGNPSVGRIRRYAELRDAVLRWNIGRAVKIHTVNVGDADARMLRSIAHGTRGRFVDLRSERTSKAKGR